MIMSVEWEEDDPFEEQREKIENPMKRLFREHGVRYKFQVLTGIFASIFARLLDLVPPVLLGFAIDAIFRREKNFADIWFVPNSLIPAGESAAVQQEQLLLTVALIGGAFLFGSGFHWEIGRASCRERVCLYV